MKYFCLINQRTVAVSKYVVLISNANPFRLPLIRKYLSQTNTMFVRLKHKQ